MEYINYAVCDDEEIILDAVFDRVFTIFKRAGMIATGRKYRSSKAFLEDVTRQTGHDELNLAFLDIDMPELNGIELGRAIKEKNPKIEIIFVSNRYEKVFDTFDIHPFGFVRKNNFSADIGKTLKAYIAARGEGRKLLCRPAGEQFGNTEIAHYRYRLRGKLEKPSIHPHGQRQHRGCSHDDG